MKRVGWGRLVLASVVLFHPTSMLSQSHAVTRSDLIGTWHYKEVSGVKWDPVKKVVSDTLLEMLMTIRPDGTLDLKSDMAVVDIVQGTHHWSLAGDTLTIIQNSPHKAVQRFTLSSPAPGKVTMAWVFYSGMFPLEWWRVDPTKPLPPLVPEPPTVKPADLAGTWVAKTEHGADTLTFRADGTWAGKEEAIWPAGREGCVGIEAIPTEASNTGKWYLGPSNVIMLIDALGRRVCNTAEAWRAYMFKLEGQHIMSYNPLLFYDRIRSSTP